LRAAVIDIGTNSARLYVAEIDSKGKQTKLLRELNTTRLGEGIGNSNILLSLPMQRTSLAVAEFTAKARKMGAAQIFIYATNAVRDAQNGQEFANMLEQATGVTLNIISGELEAHIAYMGAAQARKDCAVIDIGGGSTEVVLKHKNAFNALSLPIGAVRLMERFPTSDGRLIGSKREALITFLKEELKKFNTINAGNAKHLIGVSGAPTTLAAYSQDLKVYDSEKVQNYCISIEKLEQLLNSLCEMTLEERKHTNGIPTERADIIVYGGHILTIFMQIYRYDELIVSDRDSLEGYLEYRLTKNQ